MKYVCTVCGYVYDDAEHDVPFESLPEDWSCPLCKAPKSLFEKVEEKQEAEPQAPETFSAENDEPAENDDLVLLGAGELSSLFSNLARGCEKQYQDEAKKCFDEIADYFEGLVPEETDRDMEHLASLIKEDLDANYVDLRAKASARQDRGTLRVVTWGEKVTRMAKSLVDRYLREGDAFLANTGLYVCTVCGFLYVGDNPPELCPVCKVPSWKFEKIEGKVRK